MRCWTGRSFSLAAVLGLCISTACDVPPDEAAKRSTVLVTDGFRTRGGVAITNEHILVPLEIGTAGEKVSVKTPTGETFEARVLKKDEANELALLYQKLATLDEASPGDPGALAEGSPVTALVYDHEGKSKVVAGTITGWRNHKSRAYVETDLDVGAEAIGSGLFDASGKLVATIGFVLGPKLVFALPIDYAMREPRSLTSSFTDGGASSDAYKAKRDAAKKDTTVIPKPPAFADLMPTYHFSHTAVVGFFSMLDKKDAPVTDKPVRWKIEAIDVERKKRTLAEGELAPPFVQWNVTAERTQARADELSKLFGKSFVEHAFAPFAYGELRWRLPFSLYCSKVTGDEVHNFVITLADGRTGGELGFPDLVNVCGGQEAGDGTAWEAAWGMSTATAEPPTSKSKAKAKGKLKGKGKTKKKR